MTRPAWLENSAPSEFAMRGSKPSAACSFGAQSMDPEKTRCPRRSAGPGRSALYFTVVGEPALKMLRYQQQFTFFDVARVNESVRYVNLSQEVVSGTLEKLLGRIVQEVEATSPRVVVVDSFRTVAQAAERSQNGDLGLQHFVQQLAVRLTGWEATTFLVCEYQPSETEPNPVFTVADGVLWLIQSLDRNSMVRKIQVMKLRGQAPIPGLHTFRITGDGSGYSRGIWNAPPNRGI